MNGQLNFFDLVGFLNTSSFHLPKADLASLSRMFGRFEA